MGANNPSGMSPYILLNDQGSAQVREVSPIHLTAGLTNSTLGINTIYAYPFDLDQPFSANRLNLFLSNGTVFSATNLAGTFGQTVSAAMYAHNGSSGTAAAISTIWSASAAWAFSQSSNTALSATIPNGLSGNSIATISTTLATSNASTFMVTSVGGFRELQLPFQTTLQPGRYWMAVGYSAGAATAATFELSASVLMQTLGGRIGYVPPGTASSASGSGFAIGAPIGSYSATSAAFPASFAMTNINVLFKPPVTGSAPYFNLVNYPAGSSVL